MEQINKNNRNRGLRKARSRTRAFGTASRPRISVFRSNRYLAAQLIDDTVGKTLAAVSTQVMTDKKLAKTVAAKEAGVLLATAAKKLGVSTALLHRASYRYHGRVKAFAEGCRAGGLTI